MCNLDPDTADQIIGFFEEFTPKFVRQYLNGAELIREGLEKYRNDVQEGSFPSENEAY